MVGMDRDRPGDEREASIAEIAERALQRIVTTLVIAAGLIGLAIYMRPGPPRYQAVIADGQVVRIDSRKGGMIGCDFRGCVWILRPGQNLERGNLRPPAPAPAALPAPAAQPAR